MLRITLMILPCMFFIACGDKKADIAQGRSETLIQPQQSTQSQEDQTIQEEVIEEYEPSKPQFQANWLKTIYFAFDSYTIAKEMFKLVDENVEILKKYPEGKIILEGNTDAYGSDEYNLALGNKRALAVKEALMVRGIGKERIEVLSFGETKPVCTENNSPECRQQNRRVDFVLKTN